MKVNRDAEGRLHHIGKRLLPPHTNAESIGMLAFVGDGPSIFRNQVDQMMRTPDGVERWYLRAIDIIAKGNRVGTVSIDGLEWKEVEHGRASCRERVGPHVEQRGVGGALQ